MYFFGFHNELRLCGLERRVHRFVLTSVGLKSGRVTNFVFTGSLCCARRSDSRASSCVTPRPTAKSIRPGRPTAPRASGDPLPLPIRLPAAFLVLGLSGKLRVHT